MSGVTMGDFSQQMDWQVISDTGTSFIGAPYAVAQKVAFAAQASVSALKIFEMVSSIP